MPPPPQFGTPHPLLWMFMTNFFPVYHMDTRHFIVGETVQIQNNDEI